MKKCIFGMVIVSLMACAGDPASLPANPAPQGAMPSNLPVIPAEAEGRALGIADYQMQSAANAFTLIARDASQREVSRVEGSTAGADFRFVYVHRGRRWEMRGTSRVDTATQAWAVEGTIDGRAYSVHGVGTREETFERRVSVEMDAESRRVLDHWWAVIERILPQTGSQELNCLQCIGTVGSTVFGAVSCVFGNVFGCFTAAGGAVSLASNGSNCLTRNNPCSASPTR